MRKFLSGLFVGLAATALLAQGPGQPTVTTNSPTRYDTVAKFATNVTSNTTLTLSPAGSNYLYINYIEIENCAGAAVTGAAPLTITSTGLGGGITPAWTVGTTSTAGICNPPHVFNGPVPLKSNSPGANVTFVLPTFTANQTIRLNVWYYEAP